MARSFCERYGPGRLPYASRRDVGGGIAMAATGLLATVLWFSGTWALAVTGAAGGSLGFVVAAGAFFVPVAIPASFVVGTLLWRYAYADANRQLRGALLGAITATASLIAGGIGPSTVLAASNVLSGRMQLLEAAVFGLLLVPAAVVFALVVAGWFVVPLGAVGGWYHERAKRP